MAVTATITAAAIAADRGAHEAHRQRGLAHRANIMQELAQKEAVSRAISQSRRSALAERQANRQTPDLAGLLAFEQGFAGFGAGSRTGAAAANPSQLNLGRPTATLGNP